MSEPNDPVTPERLAELEAEFDLNTPHPTTVRAKFTPVTLGAVQVTTDEGPIDYLPERGGVVVAIQVPNHVMQIVLENDEALGWAKELRKAAQGGGELHLPNRPLF
jgi:hypothetical protein